ncbi:MAG: beta-L-arabinofuranosidase domain-containing protein [Puniceicoccaceae bacterium]
MNRIRLGIICVLLGCHFLGAAKDDSIVSGDWRFKGHIGSRIDRIAQNRILSEEAWASIYPETEEAFRVRQDDGAYPKFGAWRGEFWGKYTLSVIAAARYYDSDILKSRVAEAVKGLAQYQNPNGYIGTYKRSDFLVGNNWNIWGRKYTLWALLEAWELLGDDEILEIAKRLTDHVISEVGPAAVDIATTGKFHGMPSSSILQPVVKLHYATGEKKYLEFAEYIVSRWSEQPDGLPDILNKGLAGEPIHKWSDTIDPYDWAKGYELISCVEGLVELYKVTGKKDYLQAASNIHEQMVKWERSPIGSVGFNDKLVGSNAMINALSEVCDAVYWNRLSFEMFKQTGDAAYIEEMERTLYNSLLASFNQEGDWGLRRLRMSHAHVPAQNHFLMHHQCCTDNLPRGLFQAADSVLMRKKKTLYLNLFAQGEGSIELDSGRILEMSLDGDFLNGESCTVNVGLEKSERFILNIRVPKWSPWSMVFVNGREEKTVQRGQEWIEVDRKWKDGDVVVIKFDLPLRWELYEPSRAETLFKPAEEYVDLWASYMFKGATSEELTKRYGHVTSLSPEDALGAEKAITYFYGPLALARDVRITKGDIFETLPFDPSILMAKLEQIRPAKGMWKAFQLEFKDGKIMQMCDFSSAGNTWNKDSLFSTWCIVE